MHNRNGSTNNPSQPSMQATPQRSQETLNSKIKKKVSGLGRSAINVSSTLYQKRTMGNGATSSFQQTSNSNSRGNLLVSHNQLSYLKQSQQLQEARNRDSVATKKSIKSTASMKKNATLTNHQAATQSLVNTSQTQMNGGQGPIKVGITGMSDSSFNNMTIRSNDKYNSALIPVNKRSSNHKQRQINNLEQQVLAKAQMQMAHPLSAKNNPEKAKNIFQTQGQNNNTSSQQNLNQTSQNLIQQNYHSSKGGQLPTGASKHYLNGGGSMIELSTGMAPQAPIGGAKNHTTNLNSASVFQRSHHQIYHSKNQSIGSVSYTSNNSRFTTTRPKNPTEGSLSSKGSIDSAANHFGVSTNNRLKQKLTQQQTQNGVTNVQNASLQIDPDYLTNKSISPQKGTIQAGQIQYATGKGTNSKFNLVNRGVLNSSQFPAVSTNRTVLSPKNVQNRVISQSMSTQNFKIAGSSNKRADHEQSNSKRKLSMKLSHQQLQPSGASAEILQSQNLLNQRESKKETPKQLANENGVKQSSVTPNNATDDNLSQSNASQFTKQPNSEMRGQPPTGVHRSGSKTNKTMTHEVIAEEKIEESAYNTKRVSLEVNKNQTQAQTQKSLASASAPNLNQSASTTQVKTVNLTNEKPVSKQLSSLRQQLKTQISKQTSHHARSQNSEGQQNSIKDNKDSVKNSNPQQPSSAIGVNEVQFPISSRQALQLFQDQGMTDYEKIEIQNYPEVYFLGLDAPKIKASSLLAPTTPSERWRRSLQLMI